MPLIPRIASQSPYVLYDSQSRNGSSQDVYRKNYRTGELVNVSNITGCSRAFADSLSADGRYAAYNSFSGYGAATNITQFFRKDIQSGAVTCISCTPTGAPADKGSYSALMSFKNAMAADGRTAASLSEATNLAAVRKIVGGAACQNLYYAVLP